MLSSVDWPESLLERLLQHMERVEDPVAPTGISLHDHNRTVLDFFAERRNVFCEALGPDGFTDDIVDCCLSFLLELLEQCCLSVFLVPSEKRLISHAATQKEKRLFTPRARGSGAKRKRGDVNEGTRRGEIKYSRVLPLEYLLRLFIALPSLIEQYDNLGGVAMPPFSLQPLQKLVEIMIQEIDRDKDNLLVPLSSYVPLH